MDHELIYVIFLDFKLFTKIYGQFIQNLPLIYTREFLKVEAILRAKVGIFFKSENSKNAFKEK